MDLIHRVETVIREEKLAKPGDCLVVAVSGGPDSVALLHILREISHLWNWKLVVAHVNHRFRGEESDREADFVARLAENWGIPCVTGVIDVPAYIEESGMNSQVAAREKRYDFLVQTAVSHGAQAIVLAHHADDQAETILMRVIRGTGPAGLSGIPMRRSIKKMELIRPLLRIYKQELLLHIRTHQLEFCTDSSNQARKYTRNRIRLDVMPFLRQLNPRLSVSLNRLSRTMEAEDSFIEEETRRIFADKMTVNEEEIHFSRMVFLSLHLALQRRLIKLILDYLSSDTVISDFDRLELIRSAVLQDSPPNLSLDIGEGVRFYREYDRIGFTMATEAILPEAEAYHYMVAAGDGDLQIPGTGINMHYFVSDNVSFPNSGSVPGRNSAVFDLDELHFPLTIRIRRDGDRIRLSGLNGSKKVKDIFIDEKVPPSLRNRLPVVADAENRIIWVPGFRRSVYSGATERTKRFFCMTISDL